MWIGVVLDADRRGGPMIDTLLFNELLSTKSGSCSKPNDSNPNDVERVPQGMANDLDPSQYCERVDG